MARDASRSPRSDDKLMEQHMEIVTSMLNDKPMETVKSCLLESVVGCDNCRFLQLVALWAEKNKHNMPDARKLEVIDLACKEASELTLDDLERQKLLDVAFELAKLAGVHPDTLLDLLRALYNLKPLEYGEPLVQQLCDMSKFDDLNRLCSVPTHADSLTPEQCVALYSYANLSQDIKEGLERKFEDFRDAGTEFDTAAVLRAVIDQITAMRPLRLLKDWAEEKGDAVAKQVYRFTLVETGNTRALLDYTDELRADVDRLSALNTQLRTDVDGLLRQNGELSTTVGALRHDLGVVKAALDRA